jgi:hypothetical protein
VKPTPAPGAPVAAAGKLDQPAPGPVVTPAPAAPPVKPGQPAPVAAAVAKPAPTPAPLPGTPQAAELIRSAAEAITPPKPKYDVRGRRDPFQNLELVLKEREAASGFSVAATKLTGIVRGAVPYALVETSEGHGYILKPGDTLGDGRVVDIGRDTVVFAVPPKPGSPTNRVVLKLTTD